MRSIVLAIRLALRNLRMNFGRTFVTLIGIVMSISAIIVVLSAGESVKQFVLGQVTAFGTDYIQIEPRTPSGTEGQDYSTNAIANIANITTLTIEDGEAIEKLENIRRFSAGALAQEQIRYEEEHKLVMIFGASATMDDIDDNIKVDAGRFYTENEDESLAQVVVLGSKIAKTLFGQKDPVGEKVKLGDQSYRVVGVLEERGFVSIMDFDELVYVPVQTVQKKILGIDHVSFVMAQVKDADIMEKTSQDIRVLLRDRHDIDDPKNDDFEALSVKEGQDLIDDVFGTVNILLLALASISLLVGGVGIMNVMFVALAERVTEIGLRKALGARSQDVLRQFLIEALVITFVGGIVGIVIGSALLFGVVYALNALGLEVVFGLTSSTILIAVGFSVAAGLIFGVYPAWRASKIPPTEAMRGE